MHYLQKDFKFFMYRLPVITSKLRIPGDQLPFEIKPGFHIVVSVVSVVRKKFVGPIEFILSRTTSCICHFFCIEHLYGRFP